MAEHAITHLAELAALDGIGGLLFCHPVGNKVTFPEVVSSSIEGMGLPTIETTDRHKLGAICGSGIL